MPHYKYSETQPERDTDVSDNTGNRMERGFLSTPGADSVLTDTHVNANTDQAS